MIVDRTANDVLLADTLRKKIQSGQTLTENEQAQFERGFCTIEMLNRINEKILFLEDQLNQYAYRVQATQDTQERTFDEVLTASEYNNIFNNLNKLKAAFSVYTDTPNTPTYLYDYKSANDVEKILVDIENRIIDMEAGFRHCNTFECGEVNIL